nr:RecName: Full=Basic lectin B1 [Psophocarpus scandens]
ETISFNFNQFQQND